MSRTAYRVTTESGHSWKTSMAASVTLRDAEDYFEAFLLGRCFDVGTYPEEKWEVVVKVEKLQ